jgi:hypothetical protein
MIVREQDDGSVILVNQTDHAKLSGYLAAHWGNATFAAPQPYVPVVRAAMFHDIGWYKYETGPRLSPQTRKPMGFMQVPSDEDTLANYQWASEWMDEIDHYSSLLMRKHRNGIWLGRYGAIAHPGAFNNRNMTPLMQKFIDHNETLLTQGEDKMDDGFQINYKLLQAWDLLSLYVCTQTPKVDYIEPVPTDYSTSSGVRVDLKPLDASKIQIDPYPFDVATLPFTVVHRHLPHVVFENEEAFRSAYYRAAPQATPYEFVPKG